MIPKKILFCSDFSENSERARAIAISYAKMSGASLLVINVVNTRFLKHPALVDLPVYDAAMESVEQTARTALDQVAEKCRAEVSNVSTYTKVGVPGEEIVKLAAEEAVDLIIMGTQGRTGFARLVVGSTAETVVRHAQCPVLTVKV
jgi:universal stress protein A